MCDNFHGFKLFSGQGSIIRKNLSRSLGDSPSMSLFAPLAKSLDISQQAVAGVKKRKQIPSSWLEKLVQKGISIDFIFFGEAPANSADSRELDKLGVDLLVEKIGNRGKELHLVEFKKRSEEKHQAESAVVNQLLKYASLIRGKKPNSYNFSILEMLLRKHIMGKAVAEVIELMNDLEKIAQNHKDNN